MRHSKPLVFVEFLNPCAKVSLAIFGHPKNLRRFKSWNPGHLSPWVSPTYNWTLRYLHDVHLESSILHSWPDDGKGFGGPLGISMSQFGGILNPWVTNSKRITVAYRNYSSLTEPKRSQNWHTCRFFFVNCCLIYQSHGFWWVSTNIERGGHSKN